MSGWRAIVPLRLGGERKTRLGARLSADEREELAEALARTVLDALAACSAIAEVEVLSPFPPPFAGVRWRRDRGRGLNVELAEAFAAGRTLAIHGDLPLLASAEVAALLAAAEEAGAALAPDRAVAGTNALALAPAAAFTPRFGPGSFAAHRALLPHAAVIERPGLALDVDTPDDLDAAIAAGASPLRYAAPGHPRD